jgi:hypothetical protein
MHRVLFGKNGAEKKNLGGVIHPQKQGDQGAGCTKTQGHVILRQVQVDQKFADAKQRCCEETAYPRVVPGEWGIRQNFVHHGKQRVGGGKRD